MDEEELVDEAVKVLPEIVKGVHATKACLPALAGLSQAQAKATTHLHRHDRITVGELASAVDLSMPAASELVDRLVEAGYVEREINPADRRQVLVSLTPFAMQVAQEMTELLRARMRSAIDRLEPDERPVFVRSLQALAAALREPVADAAADAPCPITAPAEHSDHEVMKVGRNH